MINIALIARLDKIKHKGYESLSAAEKQKLFDKSKNGWGYGGKRSNSIY